jgi:signal transduction histidine kinase
MKLTRSAKKAYLGLVFANAFIMFSFVQLHHYYYDYIRPPIPDNAVQSLTHLVTRLQKKSQNQWQRILKNYPIRWIEISLSENPRYQDNALLTIQPYMLVAMLRENKNPTFSVFVNSTTWLNIKITPPIQKRTLLFFSFLFVLSSFLFLVNYLVVKTLNQPLQTIIESLNDTHIKENWSPIPLTGNIEQQLIIKCINELQNKVHLLLSHRTQVVTAISHDLRTPLTRLKLRVETIDDEKIYLKMMDDINEMELMVRDTLTYFQDIHHSEKPQRFDLVSLINSIQEDMNEAGLNVVFSTDCTKLIYTGAVNLLKRAINNIISNAVLYGDCAKVILVDTKEELHLIIKDQGPGVSDEELTQIDAPFFRGEKSRSRATGGAGLGLTISKEIVAMHKGTMSILNAPEGGLEVTLRLPKIATHSLP